MKAQDVNEIIKQTKIGTRKIQTSIDPRVVEYSKIDTEKHKCLTCTHHPLACNPRVCESFEISILGRKMNHVKYCSSYEEFKFKTNFLMRKEPSYNEASITITSKTDQVPADFNEEQYKKVWYETNHICSDCINHENICKPKEESKPVSFCGVFEKKVTSRQWIYFSLSAVVFWLIILLLISIRI